ncbi:enoyl-CoA hydratase/isomerase family protein [Nocardia colli]|uniref:enoyl-CoA hydratase/isomerase family protein n=1 Tax=Nocardia colli TaxID=2545717 RepID=UPI0035E20E5D
MSTDKVLYEKAGRIAVVTLNRPEVMNAVDPQMDERLVEIWRDFRDDESVDVAIWTGAGDAFCAGADRGTWFEQWEGADPARIRAVADGTGFGGLTRGLHRIAKPIIAAINGWTLGGGLEFALACDIRVASDRARFGLPLVRYGFHTGDGGATRLVDICGVGVALDLQLTAEPIDAQRALMCNLVTRVVPHVDLLASAYRLAEAILDNNQTAVRSAKLTTLDLIGRPLQDQLRLEALNGHSVGPQLAEILDSFGDR